MQRRKWKLREGEGIAQDGAMGDAEGSSGVFSHSPGGLEVWFLTHIGRITGEIGKQGFMDKWYL